MISVWGIISVRLSIIMGNDDFAIRMINKIPHISIQVIMLMTLVDSEIHNPAIHTKIESMHIAIIVSEIPGKNVVAYAANHFDRTPAETIQARQISIHATIPIRLLLNHFSIKTAAQLLLGKRVVSSA